LFNGMSTQKNQFALNLRGLGTTSETLNSNNTVI